MTVAAPQSQYPLHRTTGPRSWRARSFFHPPDHSRHLFREPSAVAGRSGLERDDFVVARGPSVVVGEGCVVTVETGVVTVMLSVVTGAR